VVNEPTITETIVEDPPGAVLLQLRDGTRWRVRNPEIRADSLFGLGFAYDFGRAAKPGKPVGFALSDIEKVKVERTNLLVPMLLAVGVACAIYVQALLRAGPII